MRSGVGDDCNTWPVVGWGCHCLRVKIQNNFIHIKSKCTALKLYTSSSGVYAVCYNAISESRLALNSSSFVVFVTAIGSRFHSCIWYVGRRIVCMLLYLCDVVSVCWHLWFWSHSSGPYIMIPEYRLSHALPYTSLWVYGFFGAPLEVPIPTTLP